MTEPTVAIVRDKAGNVHYGARSAPFIRDGLASGDLTPVEVPSEAPADAPSGDGGDTKPAKRGSRDRTGNQAGADGH